MHTQAAEKILELLPNLVLLPGGKQKVAEDAAQPDPVPAVPEPWSHRSTICRELLSLAKVTSPDALGVLAQVQPSSWGFNLWINDPDAKPDNLEDPLSGMQKAIRYRKAVCHAAPDLLQWLQGKGHTGGIALEFSRMDGEGETLKLFLFIPEAEEEERATTIEDEYMQLLRQSVKSMEQSAIQHAQLLKEIVQEHFSQQRRLAVQLMHHLEQLNEKNNHNETYRELGLSIFEESLKQEKAKLIASLNGGFAQVKKTIEDGQRVQEELTVLLPPAKKPDKYGRLFRELAVVIVDSIKASSEGGKGSSEPEATASTDSS